MKVHYQIETPNWQDAFNVPTWESEIPAFYELDWGDRSATITANYVETAYNLSESCLRTISTTVRQIVRIYTSPFEGGFLRHPRTLHKTAYGHGTALLDDCLPDCADGHIHRFPGKVTLSRPTECRKGDGHLVYNRTTWHIQRPANPPAGLGGSIWSGHLTPYTVCGQ